MSEIIIKNAIKRKKNWVYFIDENGNLCGQSLPRPWIKKWRKKK